MRVIFFGTPQFAAAHLTHLIEQNILVVAVVTAPDKPAGRGKKLSQPAVKEIALKYHLPVLQPVNLKEEKFLSELAAFKAELFVVIAFRMLPETIWKMPPKGTFNLHASLLPDYRGAAPINRAIMNGEKITGLTTFFINENIDTGAILTQTTMSIGENETAGELHDRMIEEGKIMVINTIHQIEAGTIQETPQSQLIIESKYLKAAPKIFKEDCRINWSLSGDAIHNHIRGLSPYPAATAQFLDEDGRSLDVKILMGKFERKQHENAHFTLLTDNRTFLKVALADGYLFILTIQVAGKRALGMSEYLNGFKFNGKWRVNFE